MIGQWSLGAQNLELGCAALVFPGFQFFSPSQLVMLTFSGKSKPEVKTIKKLNFARAYLQA